LLPPENATGNFTKIVQRVPAKIVLDDHDPLIARLRPGLSAETVIDTRDRNKPLSKPIQLGALKVQTPETKATLADWLAVAGAIVGAFTAILDIQITNSSLANIEGAIGASAEQGSWISTAYLMAEIVVIPLTGWLGSIFGLRRYLSVDTGLFVAFSIAYALSTSLAWTN
jgi:hypothetical protein